VGPVADPAAAPFKERRAALLAGTGPTGRALSVALTALTDGWLAATFSAAVTGESDPTAHGDPGAGLALMAVGGYGRGELAPGSDLDVWLLHTGARPEAEIAALAERLWYPVWDAGLKLGHAVRTPREALALAATDLDTATALLDVRALAGDAGIVAGLAARSAAQWRKRSKRWLAELSTRNHERHHRAGEVAFLLEPDLKEGRGGLRDVHALRWAEAARRVLLEGDHEALEDAYGVLLDARVELHRATGKASDQLLLERQDDVAAALGMSGADALMGGLASAARTIAWTSEETWARLDASLAGPLGRVLRRDRELGGGLVWREGEVHLHADARPADDPALVLRAAAAAARHEGRIHRAALDRLAAEAPVLDGPWPRDARVALVDLLGAGRSAVSVLEALDQRRLLERVLPEWAPVRSRPQRNAYHRFTVDRHLWEAAANAATLVDRVARPDLLVLGALFHDLGKGYPGDHTEVGMELVRTICPRLGLSAADIEVLVLMVEHHLLLPDVAMRRDLTDHATISSVAEAVGDVETLDLLHALTEADSKATGVSAWNSWKEELVQDLAARVRHVLGGGDVREVTWRLFPDAPTLALMAAGEVAVTVADDRITVVNPDQQGTFSRLAGVLALHGLDVLAAQAHSDEWHPGHLTMAASQFRVVVPRGGVDWAPVVQDLRRAVAGGLAIEARLAERARTYRRRRATQAAAPGPPRLDFHDGASSNATVIEVRAPTKIGILYRITKALAELGLDIRHATVQTIGMEVVDTFYVRTSSGALVTDSFHRREIGRAVLHAVQ
jgi:[protein-PII] uridylyltransferase